MRRDFHAERVRLGASDRALMLDDSPTACDGATAPALSDRTGERASRIRHVRIGLSVKPS